MRRVSVFLLAVLLLAALPACGAGSYPVVESTLPQFRQPVQGDMVVTIVTGKGEIQVLLFAEYAPQAVENFRLLVEKNYYDNTVFYRVENNFIVQGGDPTGTGRGGQSAWGRPFPVEISGSLRHYSGALCMAAAGSPPMVQSQFYFVATPPGLPEETLQSLAGAGYSAEEISAYRQIGGAPYLDNTDTVFGQVLSGMDVVSAIAAGAVHKDGSPKKPVVIESIVIEIYTA